MFLESRMFFAQPQTVISVPSAGVLLNSETISVRSLGYLLFMLVKSDILACLRVAKTLADTGFLLSGEVC